MTFSPPARNPFSVPNSGVGGHLFGFLSSLRGARFPRRAPFLETD